ncbi:hypothetical protein GF314_12515 [bacterium]|nr:hypothetical protein [bacterium]
MHRTRRIAIPVILILVVLLRPDGPARGVEGMHPVNDLDRIDFAAAGLGITAEDVFAPRSVSLVDGICKVNGCTGSFVSDEGLILTNHHCAFRAVQEASEPGRDHLMDGFVARARGDEAPAQGYTVRITEGYRDVSADVLAAVDEDLDPLARARAIEQRIKEIEVATERAVPGVRAEVAEMFRGRTYVLFSYTYLKDVRLVYAPPRDVGNFGGERDNWAWPRHTGDFALLRAYVGPDGEPADHHADNVPYRPRTHLRISDAGVEAGDPVFLLGYPGTTVRHRSAAFLRHEATVRLPWIVDWYGWQIELLETASSRRPRDRMRLASRLKSLHNTHKNHRGKLQGIARLDLLARREAADRRLAAWIADDPSRERRFGRVLPGLTALHRTLSAVRPAELWLHHLRHDPAYLDLAFTVHEAAVQRQKPDLQRERDYMDRNFDQTLEQLAVRTRTVVDEVERALLLELLRRGGDLPAARVPDGLHRFVGEAGRAGAERLVDDALVRTGLADADWCRRVARMSPEEQAALDDPLLALAARLYPAWERQRDDVRRRRGELDPLLAALVEARQQALGRDFVPDANGTLRLSWGRLEGYDPRDAVHYRPLTTVRGLIEKDEGRLPYRLPARLRERAIPDALDVPVCLLYSTDTVGGSSGSPVFDRSGRLVALNFDRPWEATINDYAWDHAWSRSIGVDLRFAAWVIGEVDGAMHLLAEMGVASPEGR